MEIVHYLSRLSKEQNKLFEAVLSDSLKEVTEAFQPFSELNAEKKWFDYWLLVLALKEEQTDIADFLIQKYCKVRIPERTDMYCTPVYYACRMWDYELAERLITNGASIHDKDANKITPVELAVQHMDVTMIDMFLRCYNDGSVKNASWLDQDIFQLACWRGYTKIVKKFIDQGINFNSRSVFKSQKWKGFSPLHFAVDACSRGQLSKVMAFVSKGVSVDSHTNLDAHYFTNWSALHFAVYFNQKEIVDFLLARGADVNIKISHSQMTPLHFACEHSRKNQYGIIESLLRYGASVNYKDCTGHSPLLLACRIPIDQIMKNYHGPHIAQDYYRKSVLNEIRVRQEYIVDILLRHGAEFRDRNFPILHGIINDIKDNETFAAGEELMYKLLGEGVDVNSVFSQKLTTPLHFVTESCPEKCALKIITVLLSETNIDVNAQNSSGDTPLHIAVRKRKAALAQKFLDSGVDINVKNTEGHTAIHSIFNPPLNYRQDANYISVLGRLSIHVKKLEQLKFFYRKGIIRDSILENAKSVLNDISKVDWPDPCSDYIFKCLTNIDLENLIRSTKFDQKAMKRKSDECLQLCTNPSKVVRIS
ncbi:hypothetical protein QAD02_006640 [Eretmocerus hayati]|uniref:Uncharacterized protein n=1 Tax=Eretmocerus hayati TaxID=131215 RepID=A0ACC2N1W8_9HYME|nr:hypothetical protein QAD02_006640 [Eretmocerus hayati]